MDDGSHWYRQSEGGEELVNDIISCIGGGDFCHTLLDFD